MKILSQTRKELYELEGNNIFVVDDIIFISGKVNIFSEKAGVLGQYNNEEECLEVLSKMVRAINEVGTEVFVMPQKKEVADENK